MAPNAMVLVDSLTPVHVRGIGHLLKVDREVGGVHHRPPGHTRYDRGAGRRGTQRDKVMVAWTVEGTHPRGRLRSRRAHRLPGAAHGGASEDSREAVRGSRSQAPA